jgi:DNA-directed RNA polymerase subunit H (RpoH/RPB5)
MLVARGCSDKRLSEIEEMSSLQFKNMVNDNNNTIPHITTINKRRNYKVSVILYPLDSVQKEALLNHINAIISTPIDEAQQYNIIFVATAKSLPKIKKILADRPFVKSENKKIVYESFQIDNFFENIIDNELCPKMRELTSDEVLALQESDPTINIKDLPILLTSDAMSMFYGFPINSIIEVTRDDEVFATGMTAHRIVQSMRQVSMRQ